MTAPNEELLKKAKRLRNELDDSNARLDRQCVTAMYEMEQALQSQAERIAELERESETHSKAYGLAIVERDNLRHELKTAQEGWRCECSTDDACRFARERDAKAEHIKELEADFSRLEATAQKFCVRNTFVEAENDTLRAQLAEIAATEPVASHYFDIEGNLYTANRAKFLRPSLNGLTPLFTRPMPAQDVTEFDESQFKSVEYLIAYLNKLNSYRDKTLEALSKCKGAK